LGNGFHDRRFLEGGLAHARPAQRGVPDGARPAPEHRTHRRSFQQVVKVFREIRGDAIESPTDLLGSLIA
jgi:hypothetical protein